jgi:hypothetical protein
MTCLTATGELVGKLPAQSKVGWACFTLPALTLALLFILAILLLA